LQLEFLIRKVRIEWIRTNVAFVFEQKMEILTFNFIQKTRLKNTEIHRSLYRHLPRQIMGLGKEAH